MANFTLTYKSRSGVAFEGEKFSVGADYVTGLLTTGNLHMASSKPANSACTIVDRFNVKWDVKDLIDVQAVQKAVTSKSVLQKLAKAKTVDEVLSLLRLQEIGMLNDYSNLQAQTYIKGHMLSEKLGGPGDDANLTPMTASANSTFYQQFESKLIKLLQDAEKVEKKSTYRIKIKFSAVCRGAMKPWWSNPMPETTKMLSKLPAQDAKDWSKVLKNKTSSYTLTL